MRLSVLLLLVWSIGHMTAAQITVGDTTLTIPKDEAHQEISQGSELLRLIRSVLPAEYRVHYAEGPIPKAKREGTVSPPAIISYQMVIAMTELETESITLEDFAELRQEFADGLKEGLEEATDEESIELLRRIVSQRTQSELLIENPTLVGEPEITDQHVRFIMLVAMTIKEQRRILALRGTLRPVRGKLLMFYSYREIVDENAITLLAESHAAFVDRIARANSLTLPGVDEFPVITNEQPTPTSTPDTQANQPANESSPDAIREKSAKPAAFIP